MTNPLLDLKPWALPDYKIHPNQIKPAVDALLTRAKAALAQVISPEFPADWHAISKVLDTATLALEEAWGVVSHLHSVMDTPELRQAYNANLDAITDFLTELSSSAELYAKIAAIDESLLDEPLKRARQLALQHFELSGVALKGADREAFAENEKNLTRASQAFSEHVLDSTGAFEYWVEGSYRLEGLPQDFQDEAFRKAKAKEKWGSYLLTLQWPCYNAVMQDAHDRSLRETLYKAYATRASEFGDPKWDNTALMKEIVQLRTEQARLLGYDNFAELSIVPKMAKNPKEVLDFLRGLHRRVQLKAKEDLAMLKEYARDTSTMRWKFPEAWDWAYVAERLKYWRFGFHEAEARAYFSLESVIRGLTTLLKYLFDLDVDVVQEAPVWHDQVVCFSVSRHKKLIGHLYLDPYVREGKREGAWMDGVRSRWLRPDTQELQTPIAYVVCNFKAPSPKTGKGLLYHDDVITLFHETGHALQHLLTQVDEQSIAGIHGVEWDAVELASQFMENFCWEFNILEGMSAHHETGAPLPKGAFDRMLSVKNFLSAFYLVRQIEYALFDMELHLNPQKDPYEVLRQVHKEVGVVRLPQYARQAHTFTHVFSGEYAAGYYSYLWAEVLSADAYAAFKEAKSAAEFTHVSDQYRTHILEAGATRSAADAFAAFRGRPPRIDAFLAQMGIDS